MTVVCFSLWRFGISSIGGISSGSSRSRSRRRGFSLTSAAAMMRRLRGMSGALLDATSSAATRLAVSRACRVQQRSRHKRILVMERLVMVITTATCSVAADSHRAHWRTSVWRRVFVQLRTFVHCLPSPRIKHSDIKHMMNSSIFVGSLRRLHLELLKVGHCFRIN